MKILFISWSAYFTAIVVVLIIYYAVIGYMYYRKEIKLAFSNSVSFHSYTNHSLQQIPPIVKNENYQADVSDDLPLQVQSFIDEVKACLQEAAGNQYNKDKILHLLRRLVSKYPSIEDSAYKLSLEQFIINECETHCAVCFSDVDLGEIWEKRPA